MAAVESKNSGAKEPLARIGLAAGIVLFLFLVQMNFVYTPDDAFITFRYSRNLADGYGPIFNPGGADRVEGYSCPLYMGLMAILLKLPLDMDALIRAKFFGILCGIGVLAAAQILARRLKLPVWAQAILPILLAAHAGISLNAIDGMETILAALLTTLGCAWLLTEFGPENETERGRAGFLSALTFAGCALNRPEGLLMGLAAVGVVVALRFRNWGRRETVWLLAFVVPVAGWFLFRRLFYGLWVPNTYFAKMVPLEDAVMKGFPYLLRTFFFQLNENLFYSLLGGLWWLLAMVGVTSERVRRLPGLILPLVVGVQIVFVLRSGADWMGGWRYMVAVVPVLMVLSVAGIAELTTALEQVKGTAGTTLAKIVSTGACLLILGTALLGQVNCRQDKTDGVWSWASKGFSPNQKVLMQGWLLEKAVVIAEWVGANIPPGSTVAYSEMGVTPFLNPQVRFLDVDGLTDFGVATLPGAKHDQIGVRDDYISLNGVVGPYLKEVRKPDYILRGIGLMQGSQPELLPILDGTYNAIASFPIPTEGREQAGYMMVWKRN